MVILVNWIFDSGYLPTRAYRHQTSGNQHQFCKAHQSKNSIKKAAQKAA
jgi:hypothetical protein